MPLFSESGKWVIAAQKFMPDTGLEKDAVNSKTGELLPSDILEKIGKSITRNVMPEEQFDRIKYKLRTERQSLFLQLTAEYKKRDSLVLSNYSDFKSKSALSESNKKIREIQKKIDANLEELKIASEENDRKIAELESGSVENGNQDSELNRFKKLFKNIFVKDESLIQQEEIAFYKDDYLSLYSPPAELNEAEMADPLLEKNIVSAGINTLLTGHFSKYGDFISVYVDLYSYPGAKKLGSVAEVGSVQELELVTTSIAMQLVPILTNSLPVQLEISLNPKDASSKTIVYVDDSLQKIDNGRLIVDSGIHTIQFICEGYKNAGTTYAFEGNKKYKIDVNFEEPKSGYIQVAMKNPLKGEILMNGERAIEIDGKKSKIEINGKEILGEFIAENGETAFFYIPQKLTFDGSYVIINPKPMDRMAYIDKRRKIMYTSYSVFIISLIPAFFTYANYKNYSNLYDNSLTDFSTAKKWQTATNVSRAISIGCGLFWGYELVRYLIAANSVLPQNAKAGKPSDFVYYDPVAALEAEQEIEKTEIDKNGDNEDETVVR